MGSLKEYPINFTPRGLADAIDATMAFPGACRILQNLMFDQANPEQVVARPGVGLPITLFQGFTTPTFISVMVAVGNYVYGMVTTQRNAGHDEPFCYLIGTGFITISGVTSGNVPASPSTSGDWVPPTMAIVGPNVIVTHPGFTGAGANFFGIINIANPAAPTWVSSNTATHALPSVPTSVANFNNRAYFACANTLWYSDVLVPATMSNAGQSLTLGDTTAITASSGLPVSTSSAGVVQALIIFKPFQVWQITGDAAITGSLSQNFLSLNVGCIVPRSIVQTPIGTIFIATDGPYVVTPLGSVFPLTKDGTKLVQDVQTPFQNIVNPSRAAAGFSGSIYRVCIDSVINGTMGTYDYWFDVTVRRWCGPQTWPVDAMTVVGHYFIVSHRSTGAALYQSEFLADLNTQYTDNGSALTVIMQSALFPKTQNINMKQVVESTIELSSQNSALAYSVSALDDQNTILNNVNVSTAGNVVVWGQGNAGMTWGASLWGALWGFINGSIFWGGSGLKWSPANLQPYTYTIPWTGPIVFKKMAILVTSIATGRVSIGAFFAKYKDCGYTNK